MVDVFINAGHNKNGGKDCGAVNKKLDIKENIMTQYIANNVSVHLGKMGISNVVFQETSSYSEIPSEANKSGAKIFVSIHMNAFNTKAKGVETLFCEKSEKGKKLATYIQNELTVPHYGYTFNNRGVKSDSNRHLLVLRKTGMTSCLVELGFIDNDEEVTFVKSHMYSLASLIAEGIRKYLFSEKLLSSVKQKEETKQCKIVITPSGHSFLFDLFIDDNLVLKDNKIETITVYLNERYPESLR